MTPVVLWLLGAPVPLRGVLLLILTFVGVVLVNMEALLATPLGALWAVLLVALAAFCYPLGNSFVGFAQSGGSPRVKRIEHPAMYDTFTRIWLMTMGALPLLILIGLVLRPGWPTAAQLGTVFFVALSTGVLATGAFLAARHRASTSSAIAAVDATQAMEVPFALALEWTLISGAAPTMLQFVGAALVITTVLAFPIVFRGHS